jgi:CubicO group peptidase (beta-lactamase class C family)
VTYRLSGFVAPGFQPVADAFTANFRCGQDSGAALCVQHRGRTVVDLLGGMADEARDTPWGPATIVCLMSASKVMVATTMHLLAQERLLRLDAPIAHYWPEFARAGKANITVRDVLLHAAGLAWVEGAPDGVLYRRDEASAVLGQQAPFWPGGHRIGYHALTQGLILGEVVRRVTGAHLDEVFDRLVAVPHGLELTMRLKAGDLHRCARIDTSESGSLIAAARAGASHAMASLWSGIPESEDFNSPEWHFARLPGVNSYGSAKGLAGLYTALLDSAERAGGPALLNRDTFEDMTRLHNVAQEGVLQQRYRFGCGVLLNSPPYLDIGPNLDAFGHHGAGGSVGFADPGEGLAFAYVTRRMHSRIDNGPRSRRLIAATYRCLESMAGTGASAITEALISVSEASEVRV